jgi:hypothetical protein
VPHLPLTRSVCALGPFLCVLLAGARANAFERQWHLGVGAGGASPGKNYAFGPAVGVHAAYGLSDVFDARLEVLLSQHPSRTEGFAPDRFYGAKLGIAYKLDVIQWIPYFGVSAGFLGVDAPALSARRAAGVVDPEGEFRPAQATLGLLGGLDYAIGRNLGVGIIGTIDYALGPPATMTAGLLHVEYRFGW